VNSPRHSYLPGGTARPSRGLAQETRDILRFYHVRPRQQLGQNFLIDEEALRSVVQAANLGPDSQVLEIGPGIGSLTLALAETGATVSALELDAAMAAIATARTEGWDNVRVSEGNVLHADLSTLIDVQRGFSVVANIPYYITAPILRLFLEGPARPRSLVLMVQSEVGDRLAAPPGKMSALSVFAQVYASVEVLRRVPPSSFLPPPEVASAVIRLVVHEQPPVPAAELPYLFAVVKAGFSAKRKMLHNSLDHALPNAGAVIQQALERAEIAGTRRAESLSIPEWRLLARMLAEDRANVPRRARVSAEAWSE
jgi:16S rRNA (adenine1518-N6/adenine1519-N6)-dimethyltransferase